MLRELVPVVLCAALFAGTVEAAVVEGRVVDRITQQPIAGAAVSLVVPGWTPTPVIVVARATTGADGRYSVETTYSSVTAIAAAPGRAARTHADEPCNEIYHCQPAAPALTLGAQATVVDFSLGTAARISGQLRDAVTQLPPISSWGTDVVLQRIGTARLGQLSVKPAPDGRFVVDNLHAGSYTLEARATIADGAEVGLRYLSVVWPDHYCDNFQVLCDSIPADPIVLADAQVRDDVDIALQRGAWLRSRMISSGNGSVVFHRAIALIVGNPTRALDGRFGSVEYAVVGPMLPGPVRLVLTPGSAGAYPDTAWPDRPCMAPPCSIDDAPTIDVPATGTLTVSDVRVPPLRTISGRVTDNAGNPLAGVPVATGGMRGPLGAAPWGFYAYASTTTGPNGEYRLEGLEGEWVMVRTTQAGGGYVDEVWPNTPCDAGNLFCERVEDVTYQRLDLGANPHPAQIDFALAAGADASIRGRVVEAATGAPLDRFEVAVVPAVNRLLARPATTDADGRFAIVGLTPGDYHLFAAPPMLSTNVAGTLYPDAPCTVRFVLWQLECNLAPATRFTLGQGTSISDLVFTVPSSRIFASGFEP